MQDFNHRTMSTEGSTEEDPLLAPMFETATTAPGYGAAGGETVQGDIETARVEGESDFLGAPEADIGAESPESETQSQKVENSVPLMVGDVTHEADGKADSSGSSKSVDKNFVPTTTAEQMNSAEYLLLNIDRRFQMSRLAARWYYVRNFWLLFLPSIMITMLSAVGAFMIKSDLEISDKMKANIAFLVGSGSILNVFLQNLSNEVNYGHCAKSLTTLSIGLSQLLVDVKYFMQIHGGSNPEEGEKAYKNRKVAELEKTFNTIMKQNNAEIPSHIVIAYDLIQSRLSLRLFPPVLSDKTDDMAINKISWVSIMEAVHNELFTQISLNSKSSWCTPDLNTPEPEKMVRTSILKVVQVLESERTNILYEKLLQSQQTIRESNIRDRERRKQDDAVPPPSPSREGLKDRISLFLERVIN